MATIPLPNLTALLLSKLGGKAATVQRGMVPIIRSVGGILPDVCIEEEHADELVITDSPVEGTIMTDHAFKLPAECQITYGWSPSGPGNQAAQTQTYLNDLYNQILALQNSVTLFDVYTARRIYRNVLLGSVSLTTDAKTQNTLIIRMRIRSANVARTATQAISTDPGTLTNPQGSLSISNQGTKQLQANPSTYNATDGVNILGATNP